MYWFTPESWPPFEYDSMYVNIKLNASSVLLLARTGMHSQMLQCDHECRWAMAAGTTKRGGGS